ncbi:hypothetical protein M407DRAFT_27737 [Tulasnella calospora MUT 4182]|nr:hypothetical protein M407DRAFT_27737 [Tulasnella calospora MUT 4182]
MTGELPYGEATADYVIMRKIFEGPVTHANGESRLRDCLQLWDLQTRCWAVDPLLRPTSAMCKTTFEYLPHCPPTPKTAGPHTRSAALLENLGDLENWKGNHKAGDAYLEQALRLFEEEGNDKGIASVLNKQAAAAYRDSNRPKIVKPASAALEKCRSLQDDIGVARALFWMAYAEPMVEGAIRKLQESEEIFRERGNSVGLAQCLERLGELYRQQGKTEKALSTLEEAVDIASRCGDRVGEVNALTTLGAVHWGHHHLDQAISTFQRAHDIAKSIGWEHELSTCLCRMGSLKLQQGIHAEGEELLRESVRVARSSNAGWRLAQALRLLGQCFQAQGRLEEAIQALEESYTIDQNFTPAFDPELAPAVVLLGELKSTLGQMEEALAWYDKAIAEYRKGGNTYKGEISKCLAAKDAMMLADMNRRDEGAWRSEASS